MKYYIIGFILLALATFAGLWFFDGKPDVSEEKTEVELIEIDSAEATTKPSPFSKPPKDTQYWEEPADTMQFEKQGEYLVVGWDLLTKMKFEERFHDEVNTYIPYPIFHPSVKYLDGKKIMVKGYVIPLDEVQDQSLLVISAFPYSNCFFCGQAGPESVMEITLRDPTKKRFKMDATVTFKGTLKLNDSDIYYLNYILEDAVALSN